MATVHTGEEKHVLPKHLGGGPHGLGDPDDRTLRKVEKAVLIPKIIRDKARTEKCIKEVKAFEECVRATSYAMVVKCQKENSAMKDCYISWYQNEEFRNICKEIYLKERSEYRRTGLTKKQRHNM